MSIRKWTDGHFCFKFGDSREFWKSITKAEVTDEMMKKYKMTGIYGLITGMIDKNTEAAYGPAVETKDKIITLSGIDALFDIRVKNATYARLKTFEHSNYFTPIEFVNKNGIPTGSENVPSELELEGCDLHHPLFIGPQNKFSLKEKFVIDTDGEIIQYRQMVISLSKADEFYRKFAIARTAPSIFSNERVILTGIGIASLTFNLKEAS